MILVGLTGCVAPGFEDRACTADYRMYGVQVTDRAGTPIAGLSKHTVRLSDGADVTAPDRDESAGWYVVMSDGNTSFLTKSRDRFRFDVTGSQGAAGFQLEAWSDGCHFETDSPLTGALVLQ